MSGFVPVTLDRFVAQYVKKNKAVDGETVRTAVDDALAARRQGVRCACGNPLWVAGSAVAGYGCFTCITGSAEPNGDPEIVEACDACMIALYGRDDPFAAVAETMKHHPRDYREGLEEIGFTWHDDEYDQLFEEETGEERVAVAKTKRQRMLVRFLDGGGPVTRQVLDGYLEERYSKTSNIALIRRYFKQANVNLKAIILAGLAADPTDPDLLDDLAYFSEFDSILGELIDFYTAACVQEADVERFALLVQDFHMNTFEHGYDALEALSVIFQSGAKAAIIQHLADTIDDYEASNDIPF